MAACTPTPTETQFTTVTTDSTSTSFSASVTTHPPTTTTILSTICLDASASGASGTCGNATTSTVVSTIPGEEVTTSVPIVLTVPVTSTEATATLFATCSESSSSFSSSSSNSSSSSSASSSAGSSASSSVSSSASSSASSTPSSASSEKPSSSASASASLTEFLSTSTPPPVTFTSESATTLPDGSVSVTHVVSVSTGEPSVVVVTAAPSQSSDDNSHSGGNSSSNTNKVIIGSVVGGFLGLIALVGLIWLFTRRLRKRRWEDEFDDSANYDDIFSPDGRPSNNAAHELEKRSPWAIAVQRLKDPKRKHVDLTADEPRPYQYGLVGHPTSNPQSEDSAAVLAAPTPPLTPGSMSSSLPLIGKRNTSTGSGQHLSSHGHSAPLSATYTDPYAPEGAPVPKPQGSPIPAAAQSSESLPPREEQPRPLTLANWNPNTDGLLVDLQDSPISPDAGPSSKSAKAKEEKPDADAGEVFQHKDAGGVEVPTAPPGGTAPPNYSTR